MKTEAKKFVNNFKTEYADTVCRVGEVLLAFSNGILTVVTFGTGFWLQSKSVSGKDATYHFGLWQNCSDQIVGADDSGCNTLPLKGPSELAALLYCETSIVHCLISHPGYLIAARLFMCVALMMGICAWIISIIGLLQHKHIWLFLATVGYAIQGNLDRVVCVGVVLLAQVQAV